MRVSLKLRCNNESEKNETLHLTKRPRVTQMELKGSTVQMEDAVKRTAVGWVLNKANKTCIQFAKRQCKCEENGSIILAFAKCTCSKNFSLTNTFLPPQYGSSMLINSVTGFMQLFHSNGTITLFSTTSVVYILYKHWIPKWISDSGSGKVQGIVISVSLYIFVNVISVGYKMASWINTKILHVSKKTVSKMFGH